MRNSLLKLFTLSLALGILGACSDSDSPGDAQPKNKKDNQGHRDTGGTEFLGGGGGGGKENPPPEPSPEDEFQNHPTVQAYKDSGIEVTARSMIGNETAQGLSLLEQLKSEIMTGRKDKIKKIRLWYGFLYETSTETLSLNVNADYDTAVKYLQANDRRILWQEKMQDLILTFDSETADQLWITMGLLDSGIDRLTEMKDAIREVYVSNSRFVDYSYAQRRLTIDRQSTNGQLVEALDLAQYSYALENYLGNGFVFEHKRGLFDTDELTQGLKTLNRYRDELKALDPIIDTLIIDVNVSLNSDVWFFVQGNKNFLSVGTFGLKDAEFKTFLASMTFQKDFSQSSGLSVEVSRAMRHGDLYNKGIDLMRAMESSLKAKASRISKIRIAETDGPSAYSTDSKILMISVHDTAAHLQTVLDAI